MEREKKANQDDAMQENLVQEVNEEDEPDEDQIYDEEDDPKKGIRVFNRDYDQMDLATAEEEAK